MREHILHFHKQFEYRPEIRNVKSLKKHHAFVFTGMGGSGLLGGMVKRLKPDIDIVLHQNYGLPTGVHDLEERLFVANSYSGNTEETVDALRAALRHGVRAAVITTGGKLLNIAKQKKLPYVQLPDTGIQPRMATGLGLRAFLKLIGDKKLFHDSGTLARTLRPAAYEDAGRALAKKLKNKVPVVYASLNNISIAYNWKIKFNETGKIPAFYNVLSELNHNEMTGFDVKRSSAALSRNMHFILLKDSADHPQIRKRMRVLERLYAKRRLSVHGVELKGKNVLTQMFSSLMLADWAAYYTAKQYGLEPEQVPMVEEFKRLIA